MKVSAIQFFSPYGRKSEQTTNLSDELEAQYMDMTASGCRFEAEVLSTGEVSITISDSEEDLDIAIVKNGPEVKAAMEEMLKRGSWRLQQ